MSTKKQPDIVPVILAGGEGMRLRPLTAPQRPKPFLKIMSRYSLFQETLRRVSPFDAPVILTSKDHVSRVKHAMKEIGHKEFTILAEPQNRGTGAALCAAALHLQGREKMMLVLPSDHCVPDEGLFQETVRKVADFARKSGIVSLGVRPFSSSNRYGFMRMEAGDGPVRKITSFHEKPAQDDAEKFFQEPGMLWNTGIFLCRPSFLLGQLQDFEPDLVKAVQAAYDPAKLSRGVIALSAKSYAKAAFGVFDRAVMERASRIYAIAYGGRWRDVGTIPDFAKEAFSRICNTISR